jgi:hypothetical protein
VTQVVFKAHILVTLCSEIACFIPVSSACRIFGLSLARLFRHPLRSSQRSEPSGGRGFPCFPSREELAYGQEQAHKREYDEHYLVDVIFAGRQSS